MISSLGLLLSNTTTLLLLICFPSFQFPFTLIAIWSGNVWSIINFVVCLRTAISVLILSAVPYLRWKLPERKLEYKVLEHVKLVLLCVVETSYTGRSVHKNAIQSIEGHTTVGLSTILPTRSIKYYTCTC